MDKDEHEIDSELFVFAEEDTGDTTKSVNNKMPWKVLIVDDEEIVHKVTIWSLNTISFEMRSMVFLHAYSAREARQLFIEHSDIAVVLLDVVMEEDNAGLELVKYIRNVLHNSMVRIVLRTGQPGHAPMVKVMQEYDINDYREKTELTAEKLFASLTGALRSYRDLKTIENSRHGLERIIDSLASIYETRSMDSFASEALQQLAELLPHTSEISGNESSFVIKERGAACISILAATGEFANMVGSCIDESHLGKLGMLGSEIIVALQEKRSSYNDERIIIFFKANSGFENILYFRLHEPLSELEKELLDVFSINVAIAYENLYLNNMVTDTQKEIIFTLSEAAEVRSLETGMHVKRVSEYAGLLAEKLGLPEEDIEQVRMAAPIHDVGKLGIPDNILNKPGKLTDDEFAIMKEHSMIGYKMLIKSGREMLRKSAIVALEHHERYDGAGYPGNLQGENIHIFSRIVALTDVFDALGTKRVYKDAWETDKIIDYIKAERGKHFDPVIVDCFLKNMEGILQIKLRFPD